MQRPIKKRKTFHYQIELSCKGTLRKFWTDRVLSMQPPIFLLRALTSRCFSIIAYPSRTEKKDTNWGSLHCSKRLINFIFFILAFSLLFSCSDEPQYVMEAHRLMKKFNKELTAKGYIPFGVGGYLSKDIEKFTIDYIYTVESMNLEISRGLLVDAIEIILLTVNDDLAARPYLRNYPFDVDNLYVNIGFYYNMDHLLPPNISNVILSDGKVIYYHEINEKLVKISEEPYAEAYQKAKGVPLPDRTNL